MSEHVAEKYPRCPRCGSPLEGRNPYLPSYGRYECGSYEREDTATIECYRRQLAQAQAEVERLRRAVEALQLDRRDLKDVISVLEQEQRRAGRYLEDARDELAHGRIQSAEHRIIDALVSLSSKERRTDTRLKTAVKSGGGG